MREVAPRLTAELVAEGAAAVAPTISPDGRRVAYAVAADGGTEGKVGRPHSTLWVADADGSSPPKQLTDGTARDRLPRWAPDSAALFFVSDRLEPGTDQLQRIRLNGGGAGALDGGGAEALTA